MFYPEFKEIGAPEVLSVIAGLAFIVLIVNYLINLLPVGKLKTRHISETSDLLPVSVIICARNEDENLTEFLPKVLSQDYPEFEVIVVNDCSWDNTETVIDEFSKIFPNLRKANIKEDAYYKHGKKFAMLVGIKAARYQHMVFTDADCYPASGLWLKGIMAGFSREKEIVLGYGAYEKQSGFLNKLIRYDAFIIGVQYLSAAIRKKPYMGVGRNLAYTKDLFFRERLKGSSRIELYEVENYKRSSFPFATFILTIIGVCVSSRKVRGGVGLQIALGLFLSCIYIMLMYVFTTIATTGFASPLLAVWTPNLIFSFVALYFYKRAQK